MPKFLRRFYFALLCLLPAVLFFSYYPIISLGSSTSMNFELSLPLIWLVLFDVVAFSSLLAHRHLNKEPQPATHQQPAFHKGKSGNDNSAKTRAGAGLLKRMTDGGFAGISDRRFFLFSLFPLFATISIFWSANPLRGLLTAGIIWLLFFAIFAILFITPLLSPPRRLRSYVLASLFISTVFVCLFCFLQSILDICGVPRDDTLLCAGCTYRSFGFPHPSGFAIEPQFMGNLLLAPTLTALYLLAFSTTNRQNEDEGTTGKTTKQIPAAHPEKTQTSRAHRARQSSSSVSSLVEQTVTTGKPSLKDKSANRIPERATSWLLAACAFLFSLTLFFTFSRGAIYAYAVALFIMLIFALYYRKTTKTSKSSTTPQNLKTTKSPKTPKNSTGPQSLKTVNSSANPKTPGKSLKITSQSPAIAPIILIPVISFLCSLCLQGTFATLGPTSETFSSAITKSIHQLSLGLLDFRQNRSRGPQEALESAEPSNLAHTALSDETPQETALNAPISANSTSQEALEAPSNSDQPSDQALAENASSALLDPLEGKNASDTAPESTIFEGYVAESTNIRLNLNSAAINTWLSAPGHLQSTLGITFNCQAPCPSSSYLTPTSILFGVGLGGAGTALAQNSAITGITSPKEIVQNQFFSLLLELGLTGIILIIFTLLLAFFPPLFSPKFLDGRNAPAAAPAKLPLRQRLFSAPFWGHPALPLLLSLIIAYLITLNFFSGLPNALHIYLLPPLLYLIFSNKLKQPPL